MEILGERRAAIYQDGHKDGQPADHLSATAMPLSDPTPDERAALIESLREEVEYTRWPLAPRTRLLRGILDKLQPLPSAPERYPPVKPPGEPSSLLNRKRGR